MLLENLSKGFPIAIIGFVMVFIVLAILWGIIELMRIIFTHKQPKMSDNVAEVKAVETPLQSTTDDVVDEGELVAVLTAAIAASLNTSTYNLRIKSFKRIDTKNNAWSNASLNDAINKF